MKRRLLNLLTVLALLQTLVLSGGCVVKASRDRAGAGPETRTAYSPTVVSDPAPQPPTPATAPAASTTAPTQKLTLSLKASATVAKVGDLVTFTEEMTNTGNVPVNVNFETHKRYVQELAQVNRKGSDGRGEGAQDPFIFHARPRSILLPAIMSDGFPFETRSVAHVAYPVAPGESEAESYTFRVTEAGVFRFAVSWFPGGVRRPSPPYWQRTLQSNVLVIRVLPASD